MMGVWSVQLKKLWKSGTAEREGLVRPYIPTRFFKIVKTPLWITCQPHHFQSSSAVPGNDSSSGWLNFLRELINSTSIVLCETKYFLGEGGGVSSLQGTNFVFCDTNCLKTNSFLWGKTEAVFQDTNYFLREINNSLRGTNIASSWSVTVSYWQSDCENKQN